MLFASAVRHFISVPAQCDEHLNQNRNLDSVNANGVRIALLTRAFSSEAGSGSREENASKQRAKASVPIQSERTRWAAHFLTRAQTLIKKSKLVLLANGVPPAMLRRSAIQFLTAPGTTTEAR